VYEDFTREERKPMPVSGDEFRRALSQFASGVTVVTTRDAIGQPLGLTVSAFCSVSLEPPLVLVCVDKKASSYSGFLESRAFVVHILAEDQEELSRRFATKDPKKFEGMIYRRGIEGIPVLEGAVATLECRLVQAYEGGDHTIFVGQVEGASVREEALPLLYFRGAYRRLRSV
jgi:flavin reductase (DIM6/NTAB) family NADH-FMN oxidoreductase RutF